MVRAHASVVDFAAVGLCRAEPAQALVAGGAELVVGQISLRKGQSGKG